MHLRRSLALLTGALLLTVTLGGCGFDPATNRVYTPAAGTNHRETTVDVLNAVIVSAEQGSGTFVASFVNNSLEEEAIVQEVLPAQSGAGNDPDHITAFPGFSPIEVPPNALVNLAEDDQGVEVEGEFQAGDVVSMVVELSGGEVIELDVPVVPNCDEYAGIDGPGGDCEIAEPVGAH